MINPRVKLVIDGTDITKFLTGMGISYNWIVDAYRNANDNMIIGNPVKKRTVTAEIEKIKSASYDSLIRVIGGSGIVHTVSFYDEAITKNVTCKMYNGDLSVKKSPCDSEVLYTGVSFSLIEM